MIVVVAPPARGRRSGAGRQALVAVAQLRLMILSLLFAFGMLLVVGKLALLALWAEPATARDYAAGLLPPRGDIVDRNGAPLARTIDAWTIAIHPDRVIGDKGALARRLAELIPEKSAGEYYAMLHSGSSFAYLRRRALPELVAQVNALGEPAIEFQREPDRLYPQSTLAAHVLGFLDAQGHGQYGMEQVLDARLMDAKRRGQPVPLALDLRVQAALENELSAAMARFSAIGAAGVILNARTGEVVAMVSLPSFNPNRLTGSPTPNHVTQSVFELGSTFKPLAIAGAIESGAVTSMSRRFDATQPLRIGRFSIRDDHPQKRYLNIPETLIHSSNIATARIAEEIGKERLEALFRKLGFDRRSAIEIDAGRTLWPSDWGRSTTMTTAFGHGIAITPLHLASAYAAMVNGGTLLPATLRKVDKAPAGERVFSEATSARMRQLLRLVVLEGTGKKAEAPGYRVGGKTGTAEKPGVGGYSRNQNVTTFAAAFPMDAPRYVVVAMLDSPLGTAETYGQRGAGWNAAPVVGRVVMRTGPMLGVIPDANRDIDVSDLTPLIWRAPGERVAVQAE